jgi:hypothetical protein
MISVDVAQDRLCTMSRLERRLQSNILSQVHDFVAANYYGVYCMVGLGDCDV